MIVLRQIYEKSCRISVTLPADVKDEILKYQQEKGYNSISHTVCDILILWVKARKKRQLENALRDSLK